MNGAIMTAFVAELGIITYRDIGGSSAQKAGHTISGLPLPSDYLAAVAVFSVLGFAPGGGAQRVAGLFAWGLVIATALNLWSPQAPLSVGKKAATPAPAQKQGVSTA